MHWAIARVIGPLFELLAKVNFYNENDPKAAAWLRELIAEGHIPSGHVDERSICDISPGDLCGFAQVHFFAGVGGWPLALRLAGWPDSEPVWTGSCPCQPFSCAGKRLAESDPRHLWPDFRNLIGHCRPPVVFGEQVAGKDGRVWLAGIRANMEAAAYAFGGSDLPAASVGAPQRRQRLFWVAYDKINGRGQGRQVGRMCISGINSESEWLRSLHCGNDGSCAVADVQRPERRPSTQGRHEFNGQNGRRKEAPSGNGADCASGRMGNADSDGTERPGRAQRVADAASEISRMGEPNSGGRPARGQGAEAAGHGSPAFANGNLGGLANGGGSGLEERPEQSAREERQAIERSGSLGAWGDFDILPFKDGKARRVESGTFPLAHGVPARVVRLRGYGNAIVPQVAAEFIQAAKEAIGL